MSERVVSVSRVIKASPEAIFDVLADPARHAEIDGSGMVQKLHGESNRLALGSKFGMDMKMGILPYRMTNTVVEFEPDRLIAWQHFFHHRWRYELEPVAEIYFMMDNGDVPGFEIGISLLADRDQTAVHFRVVSYKSIGSTDKTGVE